VVAAPAGFTPVASGFGAGTKDFPDRANALRVVLADVAGAAGGARHETLYVVAADLDDATGEELGLLADSARRAGALDVTLLQTIMKKGRPGVRIECLAEAAKVPMLEELLLTESSTIGVRVSPVQRRALAREERRVEVLGREVRVKVVTLPDGSRRAKAEADDLARVAEQTGRTVGAVRALVASATGDLA
jgi:pyridinium-3,5-bisthiocarboxylic acid mononucleotide nickel chelatase